MLSHSTRSWLHRIAWVPALLILGFACNARAQQEMADPPGRVATLTQHTGSVVFAPDGEQEWVDLPLHRPLTRGDRIWTDRGSRAELHMGTTALHLDSQAHLAFFELDDQSAQLSLTQGSINVRARALAPRENLEVDTPNLAVRAAEPGDWRVDVDTGDNTTRVSVRSGSVLVYGERGESIRLAAGQQATFEGRDLRQVRGRMAGTDDFDQWAADLNRREDVSVSARYVPRGVVGYQMLDNHGSWANDPTYGAVWYPRVVVDDWAPYRYGRWEFIRPWGWTWVDDAPWGFAPFHYGRWARIGARWCWVPGRFGPRPVYSPALVAFLGNGLSISIGLGFGPGIGWYPLAPGEAWWPTYRTTNVYVTNVNRYIVINRNVDHVHRRHVDAITSVRADGFNQRRVTVRDNWRPVRPQDLASAQVTTTLPRPERGGDRDRDRGDRSRLVATPPPLSQPALPSRSFPGLGVTGRGRDDAREERRDVRDERREERRDDRRDERVQREQQRDAQRAQQEALERQRDQAARQLHERQVREQAAREQAAARQHERAQQQERAQQREQAREQQRVQREQREAAGRQQDRQQQVERAQQREQQRVQREQERAQRPKETREERPAPPRREAPKRDNDDDEKQRGRGRGG